VLARFRASGCPHGSSAAIGSTDPLERIRHRHGPIDSSSRTPTLGSRVAKQRIEAAAAVTRSWVWRPAAITACSKVARCRSGSTRRPP